MAIQGFYDLVTADGSGDAALSIVDNGLIAQVYVSPVGAVNAGSTAAITQVFNISGGTVTRTVVAATAANVAVSLWDEADGHIATTKNRTTKVVIDGATQGNQFHVWADLITDEN